MKWEQNGAVLVIEPAVLHVVLPEFMQRPLPLGMQRNNTWPTSDTERRHWKDLAQRRGEYRLSKGPPLLHDYAPKLRGLFRVAWACRELGTVSWVHANRVVGRRLDDQRAASYIALLSGLGAVEHESHWQRPHSPGPRLPDFLSQLESVIYKTRDVTWDDPVGQEIARQLASNRQLPPWVDVEEYHLLTCVLNAGNDTEIQSAVPMNRNGDRGDSILDEMLHEFSQQHEMHALLESLVG